MSSRIVLIGAGSAQFGFDMLGDVFQSEALRPPSPDPLPAIQCVSLCVNVPQRAETGRNTGAVSPRNCGRCDSA